MTWFCACTGCIVQLWTFFPCKLATRSLVYVNMKVMVISIAWWMEACPLSNRPKIISPHIPTPSVCNQRPTCSAPGFCLLTSTRCASAVIMKWKAGLVLSLGYLFFVDARPSNQHIISALGPQGVNIVRLRTSASARASSKRVSTGFELREEDLVALDEQQRPFLLAPKPQKEDSPNPGEFRAQWFRQPLDHFDEKSKRFFHQRYWVNTRHYKPRKGAPVIVLDGGETSGEVCALWWIYAPCSVAHGS